MSDRNISTESYTARRAHKRRCFHCGGEVRVGDVCVRSLDVNDGQLFSSVAHDPCSEEAAKFCDEDCDGLGERELVTEYRDEWSPKYAAWFAARHEQETR